MKIYHKQDSLSVSKPEGIDVAYYLFNEYEIHYNEQTPHSTQIWHHHEKTWETIYIIEGKLTAMWREGDTEKAKILKSGDLVETERTPHTFVNDSDKLVKFVVFKQILVGKNYKKILKTDKVIDQ